MRRKALALGLIFLMAATTGLFAQYAADPLEDIYDDFDLWEGAGYLTDMPPFRPYPEPVLIEALERVARVGDADSRESAQRYLSHLQSNLDVEWELVQETRLQDDLVHLKAGVGVSLQGRLSDTVTASGSITGLLLDLEDGELLPKGRRTDWDILDDWSSISVAGREIAALNQVNTSFAWGTNSLYLHTGIMRRSFGPFHDDSVVWSEQTKQSPNAVVSWQKGNFRFSFGLFSVTATQRFEEITPFTEDDNLAREGANIVGATTSDPDLLFDPDEYPGKWVFIQDYRWSPLSWLTLSFFESATWGPRFELAYLVPLKWGWHAQGNAAFTDSSKMGIGATFRPLRNLQIPFLMYVDDANFNEFAKFNFDSKFKAAIRAGVIWTPLEQPLLRRVSLDYLAVLPYTYTHDGAGGMYGTEPNFIEYTHQGEPIGPTLEPNSDRTTLSVTVRPVRRLDVTLQGRMIRHGNASEGVEGLGTYAHDGGYFDDGRFYYFYEVDEDTGTGEPREILVDTGSLSFQEELRFLNQDNIEHTYQAGIDVSYTIPFSRLRMVLTGGYQFEYIDGPLVYQPAGTVRAADTESGENIDVVLYETVAGKDVTNHYVQFMVKVLY